MTGGTALEARYRRLLRVLPADYRAAWSDDMVDTFLESMRTGDPEADDFLADYGRPPRGEVLSVLGLAVRLRLGGAGGSARYALWGAAVRRFALVGLLTAAAFGLSGAVFRLWLAGEVPVLPPQDELAAPMPADLVGVAAQLSGLLWLPVYLAVVLGHWRVARGLGALALVPAVATVAVNVAGVLAGDAAMGGATVIFTVDGLAHLTVEVLPVLALAAYAAGAAPRRWPWLLAVPPAALGAGAIFALSWLLRDNPYLLDGAGVWCLVTVVAALVWAVAGGARRLAGRSVPGASADPWPLAIVLVAAVALAIRAVTALPAFVGDGPDPADVRAAGLIGVAAVVVVGLPVALRAARTMRRLAPPGRVPAASDSGAAP